MITLAMLGYYAVAFAVLACVAYWAGRRNNRLYREAADEAIARLHASVKPTAPLPSYVPAPIPDDDPDEEDADTLAAVREQLAELGDRGYPVAAALREVDELARRVGV